MHTLQRYKKAIAKHAVVLVLAVAVQFFAGNTAFAATCTWTGQGGDYLFSTAANWQGCGGGVPQNNDVLRLINLDPGAANAANGDYALTNDLAVAFAGVERSGELGNGVAPGSQAIYSINQLTLASGAMLNVEPEPNQLSSPPFLYIATVDGGGIRTLLPLVAQGSVVIDEKGHILFGYRLDLMASQIVLPGTLTVLSGSSVRITPAIMQQLQTVVIQNGASATFSVYIGPNSSKTVPFNFVMGGGTGTTAPILGFVDLANGGSGSSPGDMPWQVTGNIQLLADAEVTFNSGGDAAEFTGMFTRNGFSLVLSQGSNGGTVTLPANYYNPASPASAPLAAGQLPLPPATGFVQPKGRVVSVIVLTTLSALLLVIYARRRKMLS